MSALALLPLLLPAANVPAVLKLESPGEVHFGDAVFSGRCAAADAAEVLYLEERDGGSVVRAHLRNVGPACAGKPLATPCASSLEPSRPKLWTCSWSGAAEGEVASSGPHSGGFSELLAPSSNALLGVDVYVDCAEPSFAERQRLKGTGNVDGPLAITLTLRHRGVDVAYAGEPGGMTLARDVTHPPPFAPPPPSSPPGAPPPTSPPIGPPPSSPYVAGWSPRVADGGHTDNNWGLSLSRTLADHDTSGWRSPAVVDFPLGVEHQAAVHIKVHYDQGSGDLALGVTCVKPDGWETATPGLSCWEFDSINFNSGCNNNGQCTYGTSRTSPGTGTIYTLEWDGPGGAFRVIKGGGTQSSHTIDTDATAYNRVTHFLFGVNCYHGCRYQIVDDNPSHSIPAGYRLLSPSAF